MRICVKMILLLLLQGDLEAFQEELKEEDIPGEVYFQNELFSARD